MLNEKYCMYLRKSRADLEAESQGEGETLARHEKILLNLSKKQNINITKIYREIVSGESIAARPVMQELLNEVEQGMWKGVLVVEVERLARGATMDQGIVAQTFKYSNTLIVTPMKTYDPNDEFDEEYFEFGLFMSRREYKTINRRLQRGRIESVKEGKYLGTIAPYGYVRKKLEGQKGYTLEPHPEQAGVVKLIFELYTKGEQQADGSFRRLGVSRIARKLNEELMISPMRSDRWVSSTLQDMLRNHVYIGKIKWNSRPTIKQMINGKMVTKRPRAKKEDLILVDGLHEAIIHKDTFDLAQKILAENSAPIKNKYTFKNPLMGLVFCGVCGRRMKRKPAYKGDKEIITCPITGCENVSTELKLVEKRIVEYLQIWVQEYKAELKSSEDLNDSNVEIELIEKTIDNINKELKILKKQSNSLHDLLEQGVYTTEKFIERSKIISSKIEKLNNAKIDLKEQLKQFNTREEKQKVMIPKIEKIIEEYYSIEDMKSRNNLLKEVLGKIVYTKKIRGGRHGNVDNFELELYPKHIN
ncbi:MAG: recombinase family protein [Firmicutes bacterium]|nr:recombinase family protein [Bacillota bacterium]